jgi:hypothetical protein
LRLWDKRWSEQVVKQAVWLSGLASYEQVGEILRQVGGVEISTKSVWRCVEKWGSKLEQLEALQMVKAYDFEQEEIDRDRSLEPMGAAMDGTMVHIREEGWKELKVGSIFEIEKRNRMDKKTGQEIELGHAVKNGYAAHLGGPEIFGRKMWTEAQGRHWEQAIDNIVIGDGATWIWNLAAEHFHASRQTVDWYHASEHLANAGKILYGDGSPKARRWHRSMETPLYQGHANKIVGKLRGLAKQNPSKSEELLKEANYFKNNHKRMQYMETREDGFPIGSGMVESAAKQYKTRFAGAGMRWSRAGLTRLLPVRTAILSKRFDRMWSLVQDRCR